MRRVRFRISSRWIDARRDYLRNGQKLLASDLIFADGFEIAGVMTASIDQARTVESAARDSASRERRRAEAFAVGGAAVVALVAILMLLPKVPAPAEAAAAEVAASPRMLAMDLVERSAPVEPPAPGHTGARGSTCCRVGD